MYRRNYNTLWQFYSIDKWFLFKNKFPESRNKYVQTIDQNYNRSFFKCSISLFDYHCYKLQRQIRIRIWNMKSALYSSFFIKLFHWNYKTMLIYKECNNKLTNVKYIVTVSLGTEWKKKTKSQFRHFLSILINDIIWSSLT